MYLNTRPQAEVTPYLLDVQSDLLHGLDTRIVVPLRLLKSPVSSLAQRQGEITSALDFLFQGF